MISQTDFYESDRKRGFIILSRHRRGFSAKFKSDFVIELLKGEEDLKIIATENNIQPGFHTDVSTIKASALSLWTPESTSLHEWTSIQFILKWICPNDAAGEGMPLSVT